MLELGVRERGQVLGGGEPVECLGLHPLDLLGVQGCHLDRVVVRVRARHASPRGLRSRCCVGCCWSAAGSLLVSLWIAMCDSFAAVLERMRTDTRPRRWPG